ncbi:11320_t:CDS:1, partial [Racocetra persica]
TEGEKIVEEIMEDVEEIVGETMEDIAEIAVAAESTDVVEEEQIFEQFDIDNNLYKKYINDQLI